MNLKIYLVNKISKTILHRVIFSEYELEDNNRRFSKVLLQKL